MYLTTLFILRAIILICLLHLCTAVKAQPTATPISPTPSIALIRLERVQLNSPHEKGVFKSTSRDPDTDLVAVKQEEMSFNLSSPKQEYQRFSVRGDKPLLRKIFSSGTERKPGFLTILRENNAQVFTARKAASNVLSELGKTISGFISMGFSGRNIYPKCRAGFSLYSNISKRFEMEAGMRYLNFGNSTQVYTGYFGKFYSNFLFGVRTFVTPANRGTSHSYSFISRYYIKRSADYISLSVGSGISSDDRTLNIQFINKNRINSRLASAGFHHSLSKLNVLSVNAAWVNQRYPSSFLTKQVDISAGLKRTF